MRCRETRWIGGLVVATIIGCGQAKDPVPSVEAISAPSPANKVRSSDDPASLPAPGVDSATAASSAAAEDAFARLVEATQGSDPDAWTAAETSLKDLGVDAVPTLAKQLGGPEPLARELAVQFLAMLGPDAVGAETALAQALGDDSPMVRVNAAAALLAMNVSAQEAIAALKEMLKDGDPSVRLPAAISLAGMPSTSADAIPVLTELLTDGEPTIRQTAVETLGRLGKQAEASLPALRQLKSDDNADVRTAATEAVRDIESADETPAEAIPTSGVEDK